jgi:SAM-dependent methyltransferase
MDPSQQKAYWNDRIGSWDSSVYRRRGAEPWIERLAAPFRGNLRERKAYALDALVRAAPRRVLELGCGTGELFASLPAGTPRERYVGVDISAVAVEQARERARGAAAGVSPEFVASSLRELDPSRYDDADFVVALGLLPYITDDEVGVLARLLRGRRFLFDFHQAGRTPWNLMHAFYRRVAGHPFYRMHTDDGLSRRLRAEGLERFEIVHRGHITFVQDLPRGEPGRA